MSQIIRDVAFSCNDAGTPYLNVAVYSLLEHYQAETPIRINVFEGFGGHSEQSKAKLREIVGRFPQASLRYVNVEAAVKPYEELIVHRANSRWNIFTWTPIFTPQLLPDATGNVMHFDIDMLFNADVSQLFELDLGNKLIACCYEYDRYGNNAGKVIWEKGILPRSVERYFNTGTLVFNVAACREERTWEKIIAWYREHYEIADRIEQDAWNALYHDRVKPLPVKWNFHDRAIKNYAKWNPFEKFWLGNSPRECYEAALNPAILHFWGPKKPWKPSHRPYRKLYHAAMIAVGQKVPREEWLSGIYDWVNRCNLWRIRRQREYAKPMVKVILRALKDGCLLPFEWLGIGLGVLVLTNVTHRMLFRVCDMAARVMYAFDGHGKRLALENLRIVRGMRPLKYPPVRFDPEKSKYDPDAREEKIIKGSYRNMARTIGHIFWTLRSSQERVAKVGELSPAVKKFLTANRPAVTVSAHIGCWEVLSQLAYLDGHKMMSVAKNIGTGAMTKLLMRARKSIGQDIVAADGAFRHLMNGIKNGSSIGLLVDQAVSPLEGGTWVWFFGRPMCVSAAPAFFSAKSGAPIIVAWSRPLKDGRYRCEQVDEISASDSRDIRGATQRCTADIERVIRRHPHCWVMNYDFFRFWPDAKGMKALEDLRDKS